MAHVEIIKDIPTEKFDSVQAMYRMEGATVTVTAQDGGKYTVEASWPDPNGGADKVDHFTTPVAGA